MLPKYTSKVYLTFTPAAGRVAEEPVDNQAFLSSLLDYGVWLRVVAAHPHLKLLQEAGSTRAQRLGSLAAFYQQVGLCIEDTVANLIAWSIWSKDKTQRLADLMERIVLRFGQPRNALPQTYVADVRGKLLGTSKRVDVYPRDYLAQLLALFPKALAQEFGIPWKRNPSVKLVPRHLEPHWAMLPEMIRDSIEPLTKRRGELLASCYNKLKHGPQAVVMSPVAACIDRGHSAEAALEGVNDEPTLRLLLDGARTQDTADELANETRVAPFLIDEPGNIKRLFFQVIVHNANTLALMGTWIFNSTFTDAKRSFQSSDAYVHSVVSDQSAHLKDMFPWSRSF